MKVLVIGSEGYIGRCLCARLEREGHIIRQVDGMVYRPTPTHAYVSGVDERWLLPNTCLSHAVSDIDATVYLAALAHDPEGRIPRKAVIENNFVTPKCLWDRYLNQKPMVIVSSMAVLNADHEPAYIRSKALLEAYFSGRPGIRILRFGTVYGPAEDVETFRGHLLLNHMVSDALFHKVIHVNSPELWRPTLHINNAVSAIMDALNPRISFPTVPVNRYDHSSVLWRYALETANVVQSQTASPVSIVASGTAQDKRTYGQDLPPTGIELSMRLYSLVDWLIHEGRRTRGISAERQAVMYRNLEVRYGKP